MVNSGSQSMQSNISTPLTQGMNKNASFFNNNMQPTNSVLATKWHRTLDINDQVQTQRSPYANPSFIANGGSVAIIQPQTPVSTIPYINNRYGGTTLIDPIGIRSTKGFLYSELTSTGTYNTPTGTAGTAGTILPGGVNTFINTRPVNALFWVTTFAIDNQFNGWGELSFFQLQDPYGTNSLGTFIGKPNVICNYTHGADWFLWSINGAGNSWVYYNYNVLHHESGITQFAPGSHTLQLQMAIYPTRASGTVADYGTTIITFYQYGFMLLGD